MLTNIDVDVLYISIDDDVNQQEEEGIKCMFIPLKIPKE
jgi:hypothetical protein